MFKDWTGCVENGVATLRCLPIVFQNLIAAALMFVGAIAVILIVYAGIKFITSGGDPKEVEGARKVMTYAIIGAVLVLLSFAIIYLIGYLTGSSDCITNLDNIKTGCQ